MVPSRYHELLVQGRWSDLVRVSEERLALDDSNEARVWWVRGHLGALSMPASFLAAPLEVLCRKLAATPLSGELRKALLETGPLLLQRLEAVSDHEQALSLRAALERLGVIEPLAAGLERKRRKTSTDLHSISSQPFSLAEAAHIGAGLDSEKRRARAPAKAFAIARMRVGAFALLLLLFGVVWVAVNRSEMWWRGTPQVASESFISASEAAEQVIPASDSRGVVGSLSALFYSMRGQEQSLEVESKGVVDSPQVQVAAGREKVDTSGPVEGEGFQQAAQSRIDRDRELRAEPVRPQLPAVNDSPSLKHDRPAVDVSRMGRVSHSTSVYAAPNYKANILGRLEPGDKVMIEGNAGRWLRLRSRKGNGGYVLRDDVVEVDPN
jgi:hypothetical protein